MSRSHFVLAVIATLVGGLSANFAQAPISRPTVSPYLNLARPDGNVAINYYGLVKPEFAFRGAVGQLQQDVRANQDLFLSPQSAEANALPATGHAAGFQTHLGYFGSPGGARSAAAAKVPVPTNRGIKSKGSTR